MDWLRGMDLNHRPLGYEPNELQDCSTPHSYSNAVVTGRQIPALDSALARTRRWIGNFCSVYLREGSQWVRPGLLGAKDFRHKNSPGHQGIGDQ